jgi:putative glutamine amidotransferase
MAKQPRPFIGVNADLAPAGRHTGAFLRLHLGAIDAILTAGGLPVVIPPLPRDIDIDAYLDRVDGFLLTGGADLDPRKHGLPTHPAVQPLPERRDDSDRLLVRKLLERRLPVLAVGLGMQQVNVALGGTLYLHLPEDLPRCLPHRDPSARSTGPEDWAGQAHRHLAVIVPGTRLEELYGPGEIRVNSCHHQAVCQPGKGLRICAQAPDGVIEAIEATDPDHFLIAVQWHPEAFTATALDLQLFESLVQASLRQSPALRVGA